MRKVVCVTGASSGLGKEIARIYLHKGYELILSDQNEKGFEEFRNNSKVAIIVGDITNEEIQNKICEEIQSRKRLDVLINNAGISFIQPFEDNTKEQLDSIVEVNLKAPILLTQKLYVLMKSQRAGTIVFMNSSAGKQGYENHTLYSTTKFGLNGFSQSLRAEARKHNIRVISIHPGGVKTALYEKVMFKPDITKYMDAHKVAEVVVYISETEDLSPDEIVISRMTK